MRQRWYRPLPSQRCACNTSHRFFTDPRKHGRFFPNQSPPGPAHRARPPVCVSPSARPGRQTPESNALKGLDRPGGSCQQTEDEAKIPATPQPTRLTRPRADNQRQRSPSAAMRVQCFSWALHRFPRHGRFSPKQSSPRPTHPVRPPVRGFAPSQPRASDATEQRSPRTGGRSGWPRQRTEGQHNGHATP